VKDASRLSKFCNIFRLFQMISCHDCWPWTIPGIIIMIRRQTNNQWSGGIAIQPATKEFGVQKSAAKSIALIVLDQDDILHHDYFPKGQTINAEYYSCLQVLLKEILKQKRHGKYTNGVLFLHDNAPVQRALARHKELA
jgi:hypothetical protein